MIALLRTWRDSWSGEDWRAFFDERAGIAEFDGGLPREQAEARAYACCVAEWLNRNPVRSSPYSCLRCGEADQGHDPLLPFGAETMSACANKPSTPRSAPTKRSCHTSHGCWRKPTTAGATISRVK